jgi:hypothetical protein
MVSHHHADATSVRHQAASWRRDPTFVQGMREGIGRFNAIGAKLSKNLSKKFGALRGPFFDSCNRFREPRLKMSMCSKRWGTPVHLVDSAQFELPRVDGGGSNNAWQFVHNQGGILAPRPLIIPTRPGEGLPSYWPK